MSEREKMDNEHLIDFKTFPAEQWRDEGPRVRMIFNPAKAVGEDHPERRRNAEEAK